MKPTILNSRLCQQELCLSDAVALYADKPSITAQPLIEEIDSKASAACCMSEDEDDQDSSERDPNANNTTNMKRAT